MVFNIDILPLVKTIAALFIHVFFVLFMLFLFALYGYYPGLHTLWVVYFSACLLIFVTGVCMLTSSLVIFFRDLTQIINIFLQVGIWMTPIMWNMDAMVDRISKPIEIILKLNPMYYIVSGYRDSMINGIWFWDRPITTIYFWGITIVLFIVGSTIFKKLQVHFADVL